MAGEKFLSDLFGKNVQADKKTQAVESNYGFFVAGIDKAKKVLKTLGENEI